MRPVGVTSSAGPEQVGRYEIIGALGAGGMAEVLLGRLRGPSGFERLVVIKRILPHLAGKQKFVDMFLDEARVVAQIRHANVVHVHELGYENGDLFLVMEYLEGESAGGLLRRLTVQKERLPPALAAYIVAEACAGLHAAHELATPSGERQNVVHRDVSPQNLFVGYGGDVKVLDFGIALAGDRIVRTEAGQLKGKFEYMPPEQWREEPLDRRADIFALGVVLFELTTGRRLFRRATRLDTVKAICELPIPPPSSLEAGYLPELERIVLRALEKKREDRYETAAEMRRDLLALVRPREAEPDAALAALMRRVFGDRIAEKAAMVGAARGTGPLASVPPADVDETVEVPVIEGDFDTRVVTDPREQTTGPAAARNKARPRLWAYVGLAVATLVAAGAAAFVRSTSTSNITGRSPEGTEERHVDGSVRTLVTSTSTETYPRDAAAKPPAAEGKSAGPANRPRRSPPKPTPAPKASATGFAVIPL